MNELYYKGQGAEELVMEAIKFQKSTALFDELAELIHQVEILPKSQRPKAFADGRIQKLVQKHTGMDIYFFVDMAISGTTQANFNAYIYPPQLSKNMPILDQMRINFNMADDSDARRLMRKLKDDTVGCIDLVNSKVTGAFTQLKMRSAITIDLLNSGLFTAAQKAAVMLHEIGHGFTWIEMVAETACFNACMATMSRELTESTDNVKRIKLAEALNDTLNVEVDPKTIAESTKAETWYTVYLKEEISERRKASNTGYYSDTASEFLADQFAIRHGAGEALASAMAKLYEYYGTPNTKKAFGFWVSFIVETSMMILRLFIAMFIPFGGFFIALWLMWILLFADPNYNIYDFEKARLVKMRQELITRLKTMDVPKDVRDTTLLSIQRIDNLIKDWNSNKTLGQVLAYVLRPSVRNNVKQREMQQTIESLFNNDLFVASGKIGQIGQA